MKIAIIYLVVIITNAVLHASLRDLDYDEVRREGGFHSESMVSVCRIEASSTKLTDDEKEALLSSKYLIHIHTLDLAGQEIDDHFIEALAKNGSLSRLMTIDLSNNSGVTDAALEYIRTSLVFGSVRALPQVSARYGGPSTTVRVKCRNTAVKKTKIDPEFDFTIRYIQPVTGKVVYDQTDQGIKLIEIE